MEEKAKQVAELLKVLANENRLLILCLLIEGPMTVGELSTNISNITQSAISQHLSMLKAHGILDSTKKGQNITYFIHDDRILSVIEILKEKYC
ncbi:metalloregulator ArsR/SmtB family transcription factor [Alkalibaculum sp. M08DMB]|uniref:Metalloregulator ArsR/SmtB family transcription factor n=1 Tax=Alkalibaculum sporogenes TaxID=2655001 RepID=A0A6A7K904_9FIRM|nr:metalloregulator ArsR/SmtB family transcription factor [Alkalibaculum sporogenes]MPW25886.1 metalloregulator ArsR/SmtB family transcription factor [Alkalibaculum sporogenes]